MRARAPRITTNVNTMVLVEGDELLIELPVAGKSGANGVSVGGTGVGCEGGFEVGRGASVGSTVGSTVGRGGNVGPMVGRGGNVGPMVGRGGNVG